MTCRVARALMLTGLALIAVTGMAHAEADYRFILEKNHSRIMFAADHLIERTFSTEVAFEAGAS